MATKEALLIQQVMEQVQVEGFCAPAYADVRRAFARGVADGLEDRAQVCVVIGGRTVVDLWTRGHRTGLQNVFSSSKVLTSLVVAMLVDRGVLRYSTRVADIWPEYAAHGKGSTTVAQVMRHEAGLPKFREVLRAEDLTPARLRQRSVSGLIARQKPTLRATPGQPPPREYHPLTRGWIVNEICMRADLQGRTVGQFLRDEIAVPLGLADEMALGVPAGSPLAARVAPLRFTSIWWTWYQLVAPRLLGGGKVPLESTVLRVLLVLALPVLRLLGQARLLGPFLRAGRRYIWGSQADMDADDKAEAEGRSLTRDWGELSTTGILEGRRKRMASAADLFNTAAVRAAECPSANVHATARALAMVAATIVEGGTLGGTRIISEEGLREAQGNPEFAKMFGGMLKSRFTNAGWNVFCEPPGGGREGFVGWMGLGGSVCQWHPELGIGFGYTQNMLEITPANERGRRLQGVAVACARREAAALAAAEERAQGPGCRRKTTSSRRSRRATSRPRKATVVGTSRL